MCRCCRAPARTYESQFYWQALTPPGRAGTSPLNSPLFPNHAKGLQNVHASCTPGHLSAKTDSTAINSKSPWRLSGEGLFKDLGARPEAGLGPESAVLRAAGIPHEAALAAQKDCRMAMQSRRLGQQAMQHTGRGSGNGRYQGQNSKAPRARCSGEL